MFELKFFLGSYSKLCSLDTKKDIVLWTNISKTFNNTQALPKTAIDRISDFIK